jgi:hypothetical protein
MNPLNKFKGTVVEVETKIMTISYKKNSWHQWN